MNKRSVIFIFAPRILNVKVPLLKPTDAQFCNYINSKNRLKLHYTLRHVSVRAGTILREFPQLNVVYSTVPHSAVPKSKVMYWALQAYIALHANEDSQGSFDSVCTCQSLRVNDSHCCLFCTDDAKLVNRSHCKENLQAVTQSKATQSVCTKHICANVY
jgi:hypothetical protein